MDNGASSYRRFLDGDRQAFDWIMEQYFHSLVFFLNRYVEDIHTAEDLAIDAFTELIVHPRRYNFKVTLKTYLFMIGKSRALDYIKHRKKVQFVELEQAGQHADQRQELEALVLTDSRERAVDQALSQLPEDMQKAVHLVYFAQLSYDETARIMGKNRKQVDNLLYRAKNTLRIILGQEGADLL